MTNHPSPAELEGFVWDHISAEGARAVMAHLIRGCKQCRAILTDHLMGRLGLAEPPEPILSAEQEADYDAALNRAFDFVRQEAWAIRESKRKEAAALLAQGSLEHLPEIPPHLMGVPIFEALLDRSWEVRHENPEKMVELANWAVLISDQLTDEELGLTPAEDHRCRAWIELGNAYRVADELAEAEIALGEATHHFFSGSQDELLAARFLDVQASLFGDLRRFDMAEGCLDLVYAVHKRRGDEHLAGRALISKGMCVGYQGESEEAICLIEQGLGLLDRQRDPQLVFVALHNQSRLLVDCNRHREARMVVFELRGLGLNAGGHINELKVRWLEGQINEGLGDLEKAERDLRFVKEGFEEARLGYKAALASLELGHVLLRRGQTKDSIREVLAAVDVFIAIGIDRETGASLLLLQKTFERETADAKLLKYVIERLRSKEPEEGRFATVMG